MYELNLSLITAATLKKIAEGFNGSKHRTFPHHLMLRPERSRSIER
jgi:hypothetical protein